MAAAKAAVTYPVTEIFQELGAAECGGLRALAFPKRKQNLRNSSANIVKPVLAGFGEVKSVATMWGRVRAAAEFVEDCNVQIRL